MLVRVTGKLGEREFDAGIAYGEQGELLAVAPILRPHIEGRTRQQIREHFQSMGWKATLVAILTGPQIKAR